MVASALKAGNNGKIIIRPTWNTKLEDLADVDGSAPTTTGDLMTWNATTGVWERGVSNVNSFYPKADGEPNGFSNRNDVTLSFDNGTRVFTIQPSGTSYDFYANGTLYTKSEAITTTIPDSEGEHYIYFDSTGAIQNTQTFNSDIILRNCFVSSLYWDATNKEVLNEPLNETHGWEMPAEVHSYLHRTQGTKFVSGCALTLDATGNGSSDDHIRFGGSSGVIADEDINHSVISRVLSDNVTVLYREGANWRQRTGSSFPVILGLNSRPQWNEEVTTDNWQLTEVASTDFMLIHIYTVPGISHTSAKYVVVTGQGYITPQP
jgi:hypothetical protein